MKEKSNSNDGPGAHESDGGESMRAAKYGVFGALAAVVCCVGPLVPILLGLGGATALFGLDKYQPVFIGLGLLILAGASWFAIRKQNKCCAVKSTARNVRTVALVFGIGIGFYLVLQYAVVPALASVASSKVAEAHAQGKRTTQGQEVSLHVDGMTCAGCAVGVEAALLDVPGVLSAKADWETGDAIVEIDSAVASPDDLLKAKVEAQYSLKQTDKSQPTTNQEKQDE